MVSGGPDCTVAGSNSGVQFGSATVAGVPSESAARTLASRFTVACVKLGAAGALAAAGDRLEQAAVDAVERTSPFGAGDAFGGVLLVALAEGAPLGAALERACAAGAAAAAA